MLTDFSFPSSRPQAVGPSGARVSSLARPDSACAVCSTMANVYRTGALHGAATATFMPYRSLLDILATCRYVGMLMRCDNSDSHWATAQLQPRLEMRERYGIRGTLINDALTSFCCTPCALTQERREVEMEEASFLAVEAEK